MISTLKSRGQYSLSPEILTLQWVRDMSAILLLQQLYDKDWTSSEFFAYSFVVPRGKMMAQLFVSNLLPE